MSDLANAGISALRGNYTDAAISVVASLPIVGDAAKLALKPIVAAAGSTVNAAAGVIGAAIKKLDDKVDDTVPFSGSGNAVVDEAKAVHKNSLEYVGDTHVYRIKGPNGTHKIGESAGGTRVGDGASIRGEKQARQLQRETGDFYESDIRKTFPGKRSGREYETQVIERFRRMFGEDTLPGNKTNR